jgi:hypothetical protein
MTLDRVVAMADRAVSLLLRKDSTAEADKRAATVDSSSLTVNECDETMPMVRRKRTVSPLIVIGALSRRIAIGEVQSPTLNSSTPLARRS